MAKQRVLVVDDDEAFSKMLCDCLKLHGYEVSSAGSMEEAINLFKRHKPKVVLLDFNMPLVTGDVFLPVLQSVDAGVRVIVITGETQDEVEDKFKGLGYFAFFEKGNLSLDKLKQKVDEAFSY